MAIVVEACRQKHEYIVVGARSGGGGKAKRNASDSDQVLFHRNPPLSPTASANVKSSAMGGRPIAASRASLRVACASLPGSGAGARWKPTSS
jgi:hypothetical protein